MSGAFTFRYEPHVIWLALLRLVGMACLLALWAPAFLAQLSCIALSLGDQETERDNLQSALRFYCVADWLARNSSFGKSSAALCRRLGESLVLSGKIDIGRKLIVDAQHQARSEGDFEEACAASDSAWRMGVTYEPQRSWTCAGLCDSRLLAEPARSKWRMTFVLQDIECSTQSLSACDLKMQFTAKADNPSEDQLIARSVHLLVLDSILRDHEQWNLSRTEKMALLKLNPIPTIKTEDLYQQIIASHCSKLRKADLLNSLSLTRGNASLTSDCRRKAYELRREVLGDLNLFTAKSQFKWLSCDNRLDQKYRDEGFVHVVDVESNFLKYLQPNEIWDQISFIVAPYEMAYPEGDRERMDYWYCRANEIQKAATGSSDFRAGVLLYHLGLYDKARPIFEEVSNRFKEDPDESGKTGLFAFYDLAQILLYQNRTKEASVAFDHAVQLFPRESDSNTNDIRLNACRFFMETAQFDKARSVLDAWIPGPDGDVGEKRRLNLEIAALTAQAPVLKKIGFEKYPTDPQTERITGAIDLLRGRNEAAYSRLNKLNKHVSDDCVLKLNFAVACNRVGKRELAYEVALKALDELSAEPLSTPSLYAALLNAVAISDWDSKAMIGGEQSRSQIYFKRAFAVLCRSGLENGLVGRIVKRNLLKTLDRDDGRNADLPEDIPLLSDYRRNVPEVGHIVVNMDECWRSPELF